jgi:membrane-bound serine protease (ClpP class)
MRKRQKSHGGPLGGIPRFLVKLILFTASVLLAATMGVAPLQSSAADAKSETPIVLELKLEDVVEPVLATYIDEGLADAAKRHAALVLITMDTPGGLSTSMTEIISHMLVSPVPVAVYVAPVGARGASAGFFILLAADVAAMAPGTHTGAASPVIGIGSFTLQIDETMRRKITNDALAFLRSFAAKRGRNVPLAETAVTDAKAFTEKEALDGKLVDLVASSPDDLIRQLDGREITRFDGTHVKLSLAQAVRTPFELSARQRFLARIVQPDAFFLLLIVGALGLYTEFTHPGMVAPGVVGGICMILALYAMHLLPVNAAGVFLIFLALGLFILEAKLASHGVLAIGGIVSMFLGAVFLIHSPLTGAGVSVSLALAVTVPFGIITVTLMRLVLRSRSWKQTMGPEGLVGLPGVVVMPIPAESTVSSNEGMVRVRGALWRAVAPQSIGKGSAVRVVRVEGLTLHIEPSEPKSA